MSYTTAVVLAVALALAVDLLMLRSRLLLQKVFWLSYSIIIVFQMIFNGVLTSRGVVRYDGDTILGPRVFGAPVEDLGFGFALVLVTLSLWVRLGRARIPVGESRASTTPPPPPRHRDDSDGHEQGSG